ncbi:MAG: Sua5/YciO/YrdC/YwlC family protein [Kiritimatiellales bacterium]|nr:Sua5/YciO/YrdC/YwlC family protein [Kiritimatiellota bacterium]MBL7012321.1 Sua5/YciO/YrdC/YwlC family protein [Kiritimatiellales bacterium]
MATTIQIKGIVQGVGFRPHVWKLATGLGLTGFVRNDSDGVTIRIEEGDAERFIEELKSNPPPLSKITEIITFIEPRMNPPSPKASAGQATNEREEGFRIVESEEGAEKSVQISPDISICEDCLRELFDPADRRHGYPFINCVNCGPRYSIINALPYDRPNTSMAEFELCSDCAAEYADPADRRYHAQPVACPACGPKLWFYEKPYLARYGLSGPADSTFWTIHWKESIEAGKIVAVKGIGGFHLACDALNAEAVAELRRRKARENKPFALMVPDLDWVKQTCELSAAEEKLLTSRERPIVVLRIKKSTASGGINLQGLSRPEVAASHSRSLFRSAPVENIAPNLNTLGVMLPYTPMHHLMFDAVKRPLVMTSANYSSEPMIHTNEDALKTLNGLADEFLLHDRDIVNRCDDSVCAVYGGQTIILRPGRGMGPVSFPFSSIGRRDACDTDEQGRRDARDTVPQASRLPSFNPVLDVQQSRRKNLPHWTQERSTYFVTFRLSDSIAQSRISEYRELREKWQEYHQPPYSEQEQDQFDTLFSMRVNNWLDEGAGSCILHKPGVAKIVADALLHFNEQRYVLNEWVIMPNHVHVLVAPLPGYELASILHSWKSLSAHKINEHLDGNGSVWKQESYDHIVRDQEELNRIREYIRSNPRKAGVTALQGRRDACDTDEQGRRDACDMVPQASRLPCCVVGIGADMKNTFAVAHNGWITLSPYIGDLENPETQEILKTGVQRYLECFDLKPELIVHDLHPDYFSTHIAKQFSEVRKPVQHHHAHCIAAAVEHGIAGRAMGVAFDGTGYGSDGTIWGGEILEFDAQSFERKFHLRPFALPGGERAVKEPKRTLISVLSSFQCLEKIEADFPNLGKNVLTQIESGINCPMTSSMGRLFDAAAVLLGACETPTFDGEGPMRLEAMADLNEQGALPFAIHDGVIDWIPLFEELINRQSAIGNRQLSAQFHNTIVEIVFQCLEKLDGSLPVLFSGGVFQNRLLVEGIKKHPAFDEHRMFFSSYPNDSAIALGQAAFGLAALQ